MKNIHTCVITISSLCFNSAYEVVDSEHKGLPPSTKDDLKEPSMTPHSLLHPNSTDQANPGTRPGIPNKKKNYVNMPLQTQDQPIYEEMDAANVNAQGQGSSTPVLGELPQRVPPPPLPKPRALESRSPALHRPKNK